MPNLTIFNVQKCCIDDGPGIRTTIFLKGCNMMCKWCHNPESLSLKVNMIVNKASCINCQKCAKLCDNSVHNFKNGTHKINDELCTQCGNCIEICNNRSLSFNGNKININNIFDEILKDKKYYDASGGGVTFSGGEATLQLDGLLELAGMCQNIGIHTALETNGYFNEKVADKLLETIDLFLIDFKIGNEIKHIEYTKLSNDRIKKTINYLSDNSAKIILRCPIIPSINDNDEHFKEIANIISENCGIIKFEILPYHDFAIDKWNNNSLEYECFDIEVPDLEMIDEWNTRINKFVKNAIK